MEKTKEGKAEVCGEITQLLAFFVNNTDDYDYFDVDVDDVVVVVVVSQTSSVKVLNCTI